MLVVLVKGLPRSGSPSLIGCSAREIEKFLNSSRYNTYVPREGVDASQTLST